MSNRSSSTASVAPSSPPPVRLYRHALESIFAHCTLAELSRISAVSRDWQSAVLSMTPIRAAAFPSGMVPVSAAKALLLACSTSRLARHVDRLCSNLPPLGSTIFLEFVSRVRHLAVLRCVVNFVAEARAVAVALSDLRQLKELSIRISFRESTSSAATEVNHLIDTIAQLPLLKTLELHIDGPIDLIQFDSLGSAHFDAATPSAVSPRIGLRSFNLRWLYLNEDLSDHHFIALRSMRSLHSLRLGGLNTEAIARLFCVGHGLSGLRQLQDGCALGLDGAVTSDGLCSLPLLSELNVQLGVGAHVRFLTASCGALRKVKLMFAPTAIITQAELMDGLSRCTQLTDLELQSAPLDSDALDLLLPRLPHLTRLALIHLTLTSLRFFSSAALAASLAELRLHLQACTLPRAVAASPTPAEFFHLHGLRSLQRLTLILRGFKATQLADIKWPFQLPDSAKRFPHLVQFKCN